MNVALQAIQEQAIELGADVTETTENIETSGISSVSIPTADCAVSADSALSAISVTPEVEQVIRQTLPTAAHERMPSLVNLARGLKFNCGLADTRPARLVPLVRQWHEMAQSVFDPADQFFDRTREDFLNAWPAVRHPLGDVLADALDRARRCPSGGVVERYDSPEVRLVVALCRELADSDGHFFLGCHKAASMMGITPMRLHRTLKALVTEQVLEVVHVGTRGKNGRATRYRWLIAPE